MVVCDINVERSQCLGVGEYKGGTMRLGRRGGAENNQILFKNVTVKPNSLLDDRKFRKGVDKMAK